MHAVNDSRPAAAPSPVLGRIDKVHGDRVLGWAWDRQNPKARLEVEIRLGDQVVKTVVAERHRQDLQAAGIGDGGHSFDIQIGTSVAPDRKAEVKAFVRMADGSLAPLPHPTPADLAAESIAAPYVAGMARALETATSVTRQAADAQRSSNKTLGELVALGHNRHSAALARLEEKVASLAEGQRALADQLSGIEVFIMRMDESLRVLAERDAAPAPRARPRRALIAAAAVLALVVGTLATVVGAGVMG